MTVLPRTAPKGSRSFQVYRSVKGRPERITLGKFPDLTVEQARALAGEINTNMPRYVVSRVLEAMNDRGKILNGSNVLVLGVAYKPDIDDVRESPALQILELFQDAGALVQYHDPNIPRTHNSLYFQTKEQRTQ